MKLIKAACVAWAFIYLLTGWLKAWTFNSTDTFESLIILLALFVLPLPIALISFWFPKPAGISLLVCVTLTFLAGLDISLRRHAPFSDYSTIFAHLTAYSMPHLLFGITYLALPNGTSPAFKKQTHLGEQQSGFQAADKR